MTKYESDPDDWNDKIKQAQKDWDNITTETQIDVNNSNNDTIKKYNLISASEFLNAINFTESENETPDTENSFCCGFFNSFYISDPKLKAQRIKYLAMTKMEFKNDNQIYKNALFTIYIILQIAGEFKYNFENVLNLDPESEKRFHDAFLNFYNTTNLTNLLSTYTRKGKHWNNIGFQGIDPTTDLRCAGLLPLYLILLCSNDEIQILKQNDKFYSINNDEINDDDILLTENPEIKIGTQNSLPKIFCQFKRINHEDNFPFCLVLINITVRIMTFVLRKPRIFDKIQGKIENEFLECAFLFQDLWYRNGYNIMDSQKCLEAVENRLARL